MENNLDMQEVQSALASLRVDQFDEVLPIPVKVSFMDFQPYEAGKDLNGQPIIRNKPNPRIAEISTYVPMKIFHALISSQRKLNKARQAAAEGEVDTETFTWMAEQVLSVWKLTEPDMTFDRLVSGLDTFKVMGLFALFFDNLLKRLSQKL